MAKQTALPPEVAHATTDIRAHLPAAELTWDIRLPTYMLTVSVDGACVRAFIERSDLESLGEAYDKFKKRVIELVSASVEGQVRDWRLHRPTDLS